MKVIELDEEIKIEDLLDELVKCLVRLTVKAMKQSEEKGVEADMLNAIRENILFLQRYFN